MLRTTLFSILLVSTFACRGESDSFDLDEAYGAGVQGRMVADMPVTGELEGRLSMGYFYEIDRSLMGYELHSVQDNGWVMVGGMIDTSTLRTGETMQLDPYETGTYGCSGPSEYEAEFDEEAEAVYVTKEETIVDGEVVAELTITATFGSGGGDGEVTVVVVPPADGGNTNDG